MTLSKHHLLLCYLALSEASSSSGSSGNFMVMSEVTVPLNDKGDTIDSGNSYAANSNADGAAGNALENSNSILNENESNALAGNNELSLAGGSGSDTDGEEDDEAETPAASIQVQSNAKPASDTSTSQPLRTLKRLQAMLDDSDYATSTVTPSTTIESHNFDKETLYTSNNSPQQEIQESDKLWTRQDRAKYRRTRRAEKQRRDYEQQRAFQYRDIERQHIIRAERERKELEELRRKQMEVLELQRRENAKREAMQRQFVEETFTDDETDTDGMGFELPNLPVYLSDGETEEEGSEEQFGSNGEMSNARHSNVPPSSYSHVARMRAAQMQGQRMQPQRPYQYVQAGNDYNYQAQQQRSTPPPPPHQNQAPQYDYRQPPPRQQQQAYGANYPQHGQYQYNPNQQLNNQQQGAQYQYPNQQELEQLQRQYEHQYIVWAQAAANGYYYPPPTPPATYQQQGQYAPQYRPPYQPGHANEGYRPPPHGQSYPSFLPQQRTINPESQAARLSQHPGSQGFFSRDNQATQEWMQQHQPADSQNEQSIQNYPTVGTVSAGTQVDGDLQAPDASMMNNDAVVGPQIMPPLVSTDPLVIAPVNAEGPYCELKDESVSSTSRYIVYDLSCLTQRVQQAVIIAGAESKISFDSIQKIVFSTIGVSLLSYCAVSPRSLPFPEYNRLFLQNLFTVGLGALPPLLIMLCVYDGKYNNINTVVSLLKGLDPYVDQFILKHYCCSDWDISCILHNGLHSCFCIRDHRHNIAPVRCVSPLGAGNLFVDSRGAYNHITLGVEREAVSTEENYSFCM
jgi:hypothetical protein